MSRQIAYRAYYVGLILLAAVLLIRGTPTIETIPWAAIALWVCLMTLTEVAPIKLPSGGVITASSVLDYAALIIFGPYLTAWLDIFSMITGRAVLRTQRPLHKVVFNMALYVVTAIVAGEVYLAAGGPDHSLPSKSSTLSRGPVTRASTDPSALFLTVPLRPSSRAVSWVQAL